MRFWILYLFTAIACAVPTPEFRSSQYPFVSGDVFREYADHCYDEDAKQLRLDKIQPRDTIFVQGDMLREFFDDIHDRIPVPYILITHNSDETAPGDDAYYLKRDDKIIAWFGENFDGENPHPKFHQIPMGIATRKWPFGNTDALKKAKSAKKIKEHLLHMSLTIQTNYSERWPIYRQFTQCDWCYRPHKKTFDAYLADVGISKFEIAPRGIAPDTYRTWECLYVGTIPIVSSSALDPLYEDLPVLIVEDWKEITEEFLTAKYEEFSEKTFNLEKLSMTYWMDLIDAIKCEGKTSFPPRKHMGRPPKKNIAP